VHRNCYNASCRAGRDARPRAITCCKKNIYAPEGEGDSAGRTLIGESLPLRCGFQGRQELRRRHHQGGRRLLQAGRITSPAEHFKDKKIRATGTVKVVDKIPRIEIDDASQVRLAEKK
jgi:hypothetical protein